MQMMLTECDVMDLGCKMEDYGLSEMGDNRTFDVLYLEGFERQERSARKEEVMGWGIKMLGVLLFERVGFMSSSS